MQKNKKITTQVLVRAAFLTALSIVLTRFLSIIAPVGGAGTIRVGFGGIPVFISGILFGPTVGGITGVAADLIGVLINPMGQFHLGFTFSSFLGGFVPGLFALYFRKRPIKGNYITLSRVVIAKVVVSIITGLILNPIWLIGLYGKASVIASYPFRILNTVINMVIAATVSYNILKMFRKETRVDQKDIRV